LSLPKLLEWLLSAALIAILIVVTIGVTQVYLEGSGFKTWLADNDHCPSWVCSEPIGNK